MSIKKKVFVILLTVSCLSFFIAYFIIMPTIQDIKSINEMIMQEKKDLEIKYQKGQLARKINEDFKKIEPDKEKMRSIFILPDEELQFIENLENIKQAYNIKQNIELLEEKTDENNPIKKELTLGMNLDGDFIQTLKYLEELETLNYYFNISEIKLESKNSEIGTITAVFKGKAFSLIKNYETTQN